MLSFLNIVPFDDVILRTMPSSPSLPLLPVNNEGTPISLWPSPYTVTTLRQAYLPSSIPGVSVDHPFVGGSVWLLDTAYSSYTLITAASAFFSALTDFLRASPAIKEFCFSLSVNFSAFSYVLFIDLLRVLIRLFCCPVKVSNVVPKVYTLFSGFVRSRSILVQRK